MDSEPRTRRAFLAGTLGLAAATAGCAESGVGVTPTPEPDPATPQPGGGDGATPTAVPGRYASVYRSTIDSVVRVRVFGPDAPVGQGSGFVYDDAFVVTNDHVVEGASRVTVQYRTGEYEDVVVRGTDAFSDLAVLRATGAPPSATPLPFVGDEPPIGTEVVALGAPFGLEESISAGIISGQDRVLPAPTGIRVPDAVQTDAAVNPGNSGGPLLTLDGEVAGVISAGGGENIAFAVSAALTRRVADGLIANGRYRHPFVGVEIAGLDPTVAAANGLDRARGVLVVDVLEGGPSDGRLRGSPRRVRRNGLTVPVGGDVIRAVDGFETPTEAALAEYLAVEGAPGATVPVTVLRDGSERTVEVSLGTRPAPG